ncbi:flagellar motor switch phosphatase FliY [Syntrophomonas palmitatica]|uniref:flagellar motor switch phosphatase FliY n=1 Tax=Syntrophomonas palmitatica TaxID=402877 RepID=UPI0006D03579|nr:flagellar motor switch phosphatase FliY [Syntrophomonas palmitatica]
MNDGILSQDEIDALLKGGGGDSTPGASDLSAELSDFEKDTLGEIGNITMGTAATTLSTLLRKKVSITTPQVMVISGQQLEDDYPLPYVVVEVQYTEGLTGTNVLVIKEEDACIIADLMMGGEGICETTALDEIHLSAVGEAMNQMMGSATTSLSSMFNRRIDIAPPHLTLMDFGKERLPISSSHKDLVKIQFKMEIEGLVNSEIMQIIPMEAVKTMIDMLMGNAVEESGLEGLLETPVPPAPPQAVYTPPPITQTPEPQPYYNAPPAQAWNQASYAEAPSGVKKAQQFAVQPVQFAPLREVEMAGAPSNIGLIMDVPLDISVELGKTRKTIKEVLELHQGAIIQLDRLAGEPVDLLVNGKLIAKGEVVVIDENYGIRITAIISPADRMNKLQ